MILLCHRSFVEFKLLILRVMKQTEEFIFPFSFCIFPFHFSFFSPFHDIFFPSFPFPFFFFVVSFTEQMTLTHNTWFLYGVD